MRFYYEKLSNRILVILNYSLDERCRQLTDLFDRCNIRELQEVFPIIVNSIFGVGTNNLGWGLRTATKENSPECYQILVDFFSPMGPMLRLCYRLLNDVNKFEIGLNQIPYRLSEMLQSGKYSIFYTDLINVDAFHRQISSLSLNAFDYYILHFVVHAIYPLHKVYPAALRIHNEQMKSAYFYLTTEYFHMFLPSSPDDVVRPTNICMNVKVPQVVSINPLQSPKRKLKYLNLPNLSLYNAETSTNETTQMNHSVDSLSRTYAWRTESVLYFFIDIWLRYDADETRDLPSSEFIRVVRSLIKQLHTFANSSHLDQTSMVALRKLAQLMMRNRFYPFIKSMIGRWPLDSSFLVILELWLSYIQPWRYTLEYHNQLNMINQNNNIDMNTSNTDLSIINRFDMFIIDNLVIYTQVFVHILSRFSRMDFNSLNNALMLNRLVKVFSQPGLPIKLYQAEKSFGENIINMNSPRKQINNLSNSGNSSSNNEWDSSYHDEIYVPIFGPDFCNDLEQFIRFIYMSRSHIMQEIHMIQTGNGKRNESLGFLRKFFEDLFKDCLLEQQKLHDMMKIPNILDTAARSLCQMFNINPLNISIEEIDAPSPNNVNLNCSPLNYSDSPLNYLTPRRMRENLANIQINVDPTLLPIQSDECAFLVRLLHRICTRINEKWSNEIQGYWNRMDIIGKIARQILYSPMTEQWFDKPGGINMLCEKELPARLCLRSLASYRYLFYCTFFIVFGYIIWGSPFFGLIIFSCVQLIYIFIKALSS